MRRFAFFALTGMVMAATAVAQDGMVPVQKPALLSPLAEQGRIAFGKTCAQCHGDWGQGVSNGGNAKQGPPLIHKIYEPSHHGDMAFLMAMAQGTRQHHWRFGNMPPQPIVGREEALAIIAYVREVQKANGID